MSGSTLSSIRYRRGASRAAKARHVGTGVVRSCGMLLACTISLALPAIGDAPRRVVSINLCTDQLLLALGDPQQIAALGRWADNREMSFLAAEAKPFRRIGGAAEEVLRLQPDLVLAGAFSGAATRAILQAQGLRVETFAPPRTIAEARTEIARAAALLDRHERGLTLIASIDAALEVRTSGGQSRPLTALALQRRGYVSGAETLLSDALAQTGFANAAAALGVRSVEHASLEAIAQVRPDVLVVEDLSRAPPDQASALLRHPVLARLVSGDRMLTVPVAELSCAGPALPALIHRLVRERERAAKRVLP